MAYSTASECLKSFCNGFVHTVKEQYLRYTIADDLQKILHRTRWLGFPRIVGSINCCNRIRKNCPVGWRGQYQGKEKKHCLTLEVIADDKLYIWRTFFGTPGSSNELNFLKTPSFLKKIADGSFPPKVSYTLNGKDRDIPYFFAIECIPSTPFLFTKFKKLQPRRTRSLRLVSRGEEKKWSALLVFCRDDGTSYKGQKRFGMYRT